jgi:hypothetical protein
VSKDKILLSTGYPNPKFLIISRKSRRIMKNIAIPKDLMKDD